MAVFGHVPILDQHSTLKVAFCLYEDDKTNRWNPLEKDTCKEFKWITFNLWTLVINIWLAILYRVYIYLCISGFYTVTIAVVIKTIEIN